jgi:hypothetical protein
MVDDQTFTASCEFNLTDFGSAETWQTLMDELGLVEDGREENGYLWRARDLCVSTSSNPLTGIHAINHQGKPEFGYASFMDAEGTQDAIERFMAAVLRHATIVKGGEPKEVRGAFWPE